MGAVSRLLFSAPLMGAAEWAIDRRALDGVLLGASMAAGDWIWDAFGYRRQCRSLEASSASSASAPGSSSTLT
jgi:hypothetical protein